MNQIHSRELSSRKNSIPRQLSQKQAEMEIGIILVSIFHLENILFLHKFDSEKMNEITSSKKNMLSL
jgi:hypothetical protein